MKTNVYSALGNKVRTNLILCLASQPKNVTQLIATCGLAQSAVSQHLTKLRESGIVDAKKEGKEIWYTLKYPQAAKVAQLLTVLETKLS